MKPIREEREDDSFTYADVAANIYGKNPPLALIKNLTYLGGLMARNRASEEANPTKDELSDRLNKIAKAACYIIQAHEDAGLLSQLYLTGAVRREENAMLRNLIYIADRAKLVVKQFPVKAGRGRPFARPEGFSAKEDCALYIMEALKLKTGAAPGINNDNAWGIMAAYWQASGGEAASESGAGWARYIKQVNAKQGRAVTLYREKVRQILELGMQGVDKIGG